MKDFISSIIENKQIARTMFFVCSFVIIISCKKDNPIEGIFICTEHNLSAVIYDSTLFMMHNKDTAILYDLNTYHIDGELRSYHVNFKNELTFEDGFHSNSFNCPFPFKNDSNLWGGTLMVWFYKENFVINGLFFDKVKDSQKAEDIFNKYDNLMMNNKETSLYMH